MSGNNKICETVDNSNSELKSKRFCETEALSGSIPSIGQNILAVHASGITRDFFIATVTTTDIVDQSSKSKDLIVDSILRGRLDEEYVIPVGHEYLIKVIAVISTTPITVHFDSMFCTPRPDQFSCKGTMGNNRQLVGIIVDNR